MTRVARTMRRGMGALRRLVSGGVLVAVLASLMCLGALPHPADSNAATLATNAGLGIATAAFPDGVVGMAYSQIIEATGGTPPYTWLVVGGVFPAGLDISYGVVTGIPTTAGRFEFDMRVTDSLGDTATKHMMIMINGLGNPWAWGGNSYGQLGNGTTDNSDTPVLVMSGDGTAFSEMVAVSAGSYHSLGLKSDGTVWAWGFNGGRLGDGTPDARHNPVQVIGLAGISAIAAGAGHSLALKSDGTVWAWGFNTRGQLGDGTTALRDPAIQLSTIAQVVAVSAGGNHSLALKSDGTVWAWGNNHYGQLGDGTAVDKHTPVQVSGLSEVVSISAGDAHSLALKSDGTVWAWGYNGEGQLGEGTTTSSNVPVQVKGPGGSGGLAEVAAVSAGYYHSLALKSDGTVWAWGNNDHGQLGNNATDPSYVPVQAGRAEFVAIDAGYDHSLAVSSFGLAYGWGSNEAGQIGTGMSATETHSPVAIPALTFDVLAVSAGRSFSLAVSTKLSIITTALRDAAEGTAYYQTLVACGGTPPYTWMINTGHLPDGLSLDSATGAISGTPTEYALGEYFLVVVSDSLGQADNRVLHIDVKDELAILVVTLPVGVVGEPYECYLYASGAVEPCTWSITASVLPPGLSILPREDSHDADISGTPTSGGTYDLTVVVSDSYGRTDTQDLSITITRPDNHRPVAYDRVVTTAHEMPRNIMLTAGDYEGDFLTYTVITGPSHGTLVGAAPMLTYTPDSEYIGSDSFTFSANDGTDDSNVATISIVLTANHVPVAVNDEYSMDKDSTLVVAAPGILGNDTDADGDPLKVHAVDNPAHAMAFEYYDDGTFGYVPEAGFTGIDYFVYKATDGKDASDVAYVFIRVSSNHAPVAVSDEYSMDEDSTLTVSAPGVLENDTDADGDPLRAILVDNAAHGVLTIHSDGSFSYTPDAGFTGIDYFNYKANDGDNDSLGVGTVVITVNAVNHAPVAVDDGYSADEDAVLTVVAPGILSNDTDADGDPLTAMLVTGPWHGTLTLDANGSFIYTPDADFNGSDNFTYMAKDGTTYSDVATVVITVGIPPAVVSCDAAGNPVEQFAPGQRVYVKGSGLEPNTAYKIWIQDDPVAEGDALASGEDPSGIQEDVTTDGDGAFGPVLIWEIPADCGTSYDTYDIVLDKQDDGDDTGTYNSGSDGIDSLAAVGFCAPVPEVSTLVLLGGGLLLLGGWVVLRKKRAVAA